MYECVVATSDQQDTGFTKISEFVFIDFIKKKNKKKNRKQRESTHTHVNETVRFILQFIHSSFKNCFF